MSGPDSEQGSSAIYPVYRLQHHAGGGTKLDSTTCAENVASTQRSVAEPLVLVDNFQCGSQLGRGHKGNQGRVLRPS